MRSKISEISNDILRIGLGIGYIFTGLFIFQDVGRWETLVMPWVKNILPISVETSLYLTAIFDILVGVSFLINKYVWIAAGLSALHMVQVLFVTGINWITYRDVAILAASISLFIEDFFIKGHEH